jgi:hypothetical protein
VFDPLGLISRENLPILVPIWKLKYGAGGGDPGEG